MNKELIKKRFGRKLNSYNDNAKVQKQMAQKLLSLLKDSCFNSILEIGCGTGLLTKIASNDFKYSAYTAVDIVPECENYIKNINPNIRFLAIDAEDFINNTQQKFNLILSNASMQWMENLPDFTKRLMERLEPNGVLLFSTFGKENFREINYILEKTLPYYSKIELEKLFPDSYIEEEVRIMAFRTPKEALKHIQDTGVNAISSVNWTKRNLIKFENEYNSLCANHPTLTYNPIYVLIQK